MSRDGLGICSRPDWQEDKENWMAEKPTARDPIRILFVEDNSDDAALALHALKSGGLEVEADVVCSRDDFSRRLSERSYQVILCDFRLPGWNGLDALRWLRSSGHTMPFIYVS